MAREIINTKADYDVVGDGSKDCTQNLLDAFADAKQQIVNGNSCIIQVPGGDIAISGTLELVGTTAGAPMLQGLDGGAFDLKSSRLAWTGPAGGTVLKTTAFNRGRIENVAINMGSAS